jgi:hypothetical protein
MSAFGNDDVGEHRGVLLEIAALERRQLIFGVIGVLRSALLRTSLFP